MLSTFASKSPKRLISCRFGERGGFSSLLARFQSEKPLSIPIVCALIKPFGYCYELLTVHTIVTYFLPVVVSCQPSELD